MSITIEREYLTVAEAAAIWRVSVPTVYRRCRDGSIPHVRVGGEDGPIRILARAFAIPASATDLQQDEAVEPSQHAGARTMKEEL